MCVNPEWSEPAILWTVVAARKGEKKTAALKRLVSIVEVSKYLHAYVIVWFPVVLGINRMSNAQIIVRGPAEYNLYASAISPKYQSKPCYQVLIP